MKVSIGKNTLGGGKKMMTRLNNYNRSTHDLSFICRTSIAPGVLVPTLKIKVLPGDTFPIKTRCHTLTHPTIGPLFGSFKQQNDFFFCPDRLYNAMLHNNALNIGLDMKSVKFPIFQLDTGGWNQNRYIEGSGGTIKRQVHPSSLLSYLGYKSLTPQDTDSGIADWNATPIIMYFDIFKNYYANKQEKNFYTISGFNNIPFTIATNANNTYALCVLNTDSGGDYPIKKQINSSTGTTIINPDEGDNLRFGIIINPDKNSTPKIKTSDIFLQIKMQVRYQLGGGELNVVRYDEQGTLDNLVSKGVLQKATLEAGSSPASNGLLYIFNNSLNVGTFPMIIDIQDTPIVRVETALYKSYPLEAIDDMRENILGAGREIYKVQDLFITDIYQDVPDEKIDINNYKRPTCSYPMVGLALKTYQSDINTNWVNTEWIDGETGINAITAIDTSSGKFTLDTLNLARKVYTMLNRIAVSDGSYNAWIQTVYTSGGLNHIETPLYLGGSSLEIEFQEVINNSGTEDQPLGTLAGRGVSTSHKGGNIVFKADEPGYIFCITSITPRTDYFQGNDWDIYLKTMDDLHKPQLDGIGFQDRLYRNINASGRFEEQNNSIGKQPAWIEYMTNVNKTFGNFALLENEGWMCLNRIFGEINTYTTYIFPHLYNNIFADTDITAQNFWVQIGFDIKPRRVMSAKIIPNI